MYTSKITYIPGARRNFLSGEVSGSLSTLYVIIIIFYFFFGGGGMIVISVSVISSLSHQVDINDS